MIAKNARPSLNDLLLQPAVVDELRERFTYIQDSVTTTIHEAATLTRLSEAQLRYVEARGMLSPNRAARNMTAIDTHLRGQRRYTPDNLLRAHLIAFLLDHGYTLSEVSTYMDNNSSIIHDLLHTDALRLKPLLESADDIQFRRYFIPRALHYALSLIFERDAVSDAGVIIPVRANASELAEMEPDGIASADDLFHLGHTFVAWAARGRPVAVFVTAGNPFEREQHVRLTPFSALLNDDAPEEPQGGASSMPIHAYIAYEPHVAPELEQAKRLLNLRVSRDRLSEPSNQRLANPRAVAGRLLHHIQLLCCAHLAASGPADTGEGNALLYSAPELFNPTLGDMLLNRLASAVVELGGMSQQKPEQTRWRFACVLTPREPGASLKQQELVVRAQSELGPHRIGVTTTSPKSNGGLSFRAFSSGRVIYRPRVIPLDPAVSYTREEAPIESAIAAPAAEGYGVGLGQPPAVLYITSSEPEAFNPDDFLMIRVVGQMVGEVVQSYNSRGHQPSTLTDALANPEIVDGFFADFLADLDFMGDVTTILQRLKGNDPDALEQATNPFYNDLKTLTIVGLDVNDFATIQRRQGERVARMLIREIGLRARQRMNNSFAHGAQMTRLYRAWGDRFFMVVRDEDASDARAHAERIRQDISGIYQLDGETIKSVRRPQSPQGLQSQLATLGADGVIVCVRMAGMTLDRTELATRLSERDDVNTYVATLTRLLDDGLKQANETPDPYHRSLWWSATLKSFVQVESMPTDLHPASGVTTTLSD